MIERMEKIRSMRRPGAKPYFGFPPLAPSPRLLYREINYCNYTILYDLFHEEKSSFANPEFQEMERLELYTVALMEFARYSPKRCACDWLIYEAATERPVGVLHLYDLTLERQNEKNEKCTIGFAIGEHFRRQRYATEAISHLLQYVFSHFDINIVVAYTDKHNEPTNNLLRKLSFLPNHEDYLYRERYAFYELVKEHWRDGPLSVSLPVR